MFEPGARTRELVDAWFADAGLRPRPAMELGSTEAMKEIVAAGLGCAILPGMAVPEGRGRHGLKVRSLSPRVSRTLAVVLRGDKPLNRGLGQLQAALLSLGSKRLKHGHKKTLE